MIEDHDTVPFTPFHFGPGAMIKGVLANHFSLLVFCFANVLMDVEVLVFMARGEERWHGPCHSYLGAVVVALVSVAIGWPLCRRVMQWWTSQPDVPLKDLYAFRQDIGPIAAVTGAFTGTLSHILFDAVVHGDVRPLAPFSQANPYFGFLSPGAVYALCFIVGLVGIVLCARRARKSMRREYWKR